MGIPNIIYGDFGDEKQTSSTKIGNLPLGTLMVLPDSRKYRHAKASATALSAALIYQADTPDNIYGWTDADFPCSLIAASAAIGVTTVTFTMSGTAATSVDQLAGDYLFVANSAGVGEVYKIKTNAGAVAAATETLTLDANDPLKVAHVAGSTIMGICPNPYKKITLGSAASTGTGTLIGVPNVAVPANYYCWAQRSGPCAIQADGSTVVIGLAVGVSAATAGNCKVINAAGSASWKATDRIGYCMSLSGTVQRTVMVDLTLEQ